MKSTSGIVAVALVCAAVPASATTVDDFQIWGSVNFGIALSDRVVGALELSGRLADDTSRLGTIIVRPTIGYRIDDDVTVHIGYVRQVSVGRNTIDTNENRIFQQTNWRMGKIGNTTVNSRTRIELRTVEGARDAGLRVRQRVQVQIPLKADNTNFLVSSEHAFALNSTDWGARAGFDQMRNFVGVQMPLSARVTLETGFQHRYQRRSGQPDRSDFVLPVTLGVKL